MVLMLSVLGVLGLRVLRVLTCGGGVLVLLELMLWLPHLTVAVARVIPGPAHDDVGAGRGFDEPVPAR